MAGSRVSPSPSLEAGAGLRIGITVIVRSIGRATLHEALASVRAQQPGDVEVLVVDAAGTGAIDTAVEPAPRWLCFGRALHRTEAAQAGLDAVNTRHALFLDDDDWLLEGHLRKLTAALGASPDAVLAHTGVQMVDDTGGAASARGVFDAAFEPWELLLGNRFPIHAALFDVARLRAAGVAFDRSLDVYEDWDFWLQLAEVGPFVHVPGVSASYRVHDAASQVHRLQHGDEPFWCVWRKWWQRAPRAWWNRALYQREVVVGLNGELVAVRAERDEHARRRHEQDRLLHEQTLSMQQLSQSF